MKEKAYEENLELQDEGRVVVDDLEIEIERMRKLLSAGIVEPDYDKGIIEGP